MADKTINQLTEETTSATGDFAPIWDTSAGATKKVSLANIIPDDSVTTAKLADGSVTAAKLDFATFPAFLAVRTSTQSIPDQTATKVECNTEVYDNLGDYDHTTNFRFTAPVAGTYLFDAGVVLSVVAGTRAMIALYVNGVENTRMTDVEGTNIRAISGVASLRLNQGDYVELFIFRTNGPNNITPIGRGIYFSGRLVA